jgi:hypothetical protein
MAGNSATCYVHFDRSACPTLKKINHGLLLCQKNVNGVYVYHFIANSDEDIIKKFEQKLL